MTKPNYCTRCGLDTETATRFVYCDDCAVILTKKAELQARRIKKD